MKKKHEIYHCPVCGNIIEVLNPGALMVCCGKPMLLLKENTSDASEEKHVPMITPTDNGYKVTIGTIQHPMTHDHYIQWIELLTGNGIMRQELSPEDKPEATFITHSKAPIARAFCNIHGLWKKKGY